jgi:hypothetical protein
MGQKRQRNLQRNLMKKAIRQRQVTQQVKDHNAAVMATAFVKAQIPQERDDALDEVRDAMREYRRLSANFWYVDCGVEEKDGGFKARLMHIQEDGSWKCVNKSIGIYKDEATARNICGPMLPIVAVKWGDQFLWPYVDIRKEHAMADARRRRKRRASKQGGIV